MRYSLGPSSRLDPQAYLRVAHALEQRDGDVAIGANIRPADSLPVRLHAELRYSRFGQGSAIRPAAYVAGGVYDVAGPAKTRLRAYGAAGYVAGEAATAFIDGQAVLEREVLSANRARLLAGVGAWGGAQDGTERLDIGPTIAVQFPIDAGTARLSLDYRARVAGRADPPSGIAVTLATSF